MTLLSGVLAMGRARGDARHTETVTVGLYERKTGPDGKAVRSLVEAAFAGTARIKWVSMVVTTKDVAAQPTTTQRPELHVSVGAGSAIRVGHEVVVTASTADPDLVGRVFTVSGRAQAGQVTQSRFPLTEVT